MKVLELSKIVNALLYEGYADADVFVQDENSLARYPVSILTKENLKLGDAQLKSILIPYTDPSKIKAERSEPILTDASGRPIPASRRPILLNKK